MKTTVQKIRRGGTTANRRSNTNNRSGNRRRRYGLAKKSWTVINSLIASNVPNKKIRKMNESSTATRTKCCKMSDSVGDTRLHGMPKKWAAPAAYKYATK